ncbi:transcription factor BIM1 [Lactuca sativa]|uniref:transcription factor BIM1 n=1 Tax=Lactuca sativa TaxID=4236 RepID=UPI000CAEA9A6|nr:transcription factor BIM1 [Lactuca sativa]
MEFSQPRPCGAQGAKPTHDFLSLYSPPQQDPTPSIPGGFLKTHDFFQPLDQQVEKEGNKFDHILPGGIATYSISQISSSSYSYMNMNQIQSQKVVPKAEGVEISGAQCQSSSINNNNDENSNCSSYTGSGFTFWEESNVNKGKSGKIGMPWMTSHSKAVNTGEKPNSPRSKHSATEQRRRSKINDRFSMLRGIIPHADQKRDKASFLLEVIEYIQFLQEKVNKYEDSYQGRNNKPPLNNIPTDEPQLPNGIISVSTMYSQGISSALTQALKSSGVDLSKANISVELDLGKRSSTNLKENESPSIEESGEGLKRLKRRRQ